MKRIGMEKMQMKNGLKDVDYKALGMRLKKVRLLRQYTQEGLAEKSGIIGSYVGVVERAEKKPSISTLVRIANALNCSLDYLLYDSLVYEDGRVYSINNDTPVKAKELGTVADLNSLNDRLLELLGGTGTGRREGEIKLILEILKNISAYYKDN